MSTPNPPRIEYRIQRRIVEHDGTEAWLDVASLPRHVPISAALADLESVPSRRLVKVAITETY